MLFWGRFFNYGNPPLVMKHDKLKPWENIMSDSWFDQYIWHRANRVCISFVTEGDNNEAYLPAEIPNSFCFGNFEHRFRSVRLSIGFNQRQNFHGTRYARAIWFSMRQKMIMWSFESESCEAAIIRVKVPLDCPKTPSVAPAGSW